MSLDSSLGVLFLTFAFVAFCDRLLSVEYFMRLVLRTMASKLTIESFAPDSCAAVAGTFFQKRASARNIEGGLPPSEPVGAASCVDFTFSFGAKLPRDVEQAISFVARTPIGEARKLRYDALGNLRGGGRTQ